MATSSSSLSKMGGGGIYSFVLFFLAFSFCVLLDRNGGGGVQNGRMLSSVLSSSSSIMTGAEAKGIMDYVNEDDDFREARKWAKDTGLLEGMDISSYGEKVTLILPSNEAMIDVEDNQPFRVQHLMNDSEDLETLMLFASTDHVVEKYDIEDGVYEDKYAIISLLSEYSSISIDGELCIAGDDRDISCDDSSNSEPCCASIIWSKTKIADDGIIYVIDRVVFPQELLTRF